jgi:hypothetical protein
MPQNAISVVKWEKKKLEKRKWERRKQIEVGAIRERKFCNFFFIIKKKLGFCHTQG